eukprot:NODE_30223_length_424_cov_2.363636.p2 GENE.NODE_30223_length_424_cov_2.363636~~NODE_30223_length_424_cov_2.363636.p2  ORF type:complete len:105 (+),score=19.14 NODE_30223_length_424_cov_2.363636:60-374(+)
MCSVSRFFFFKLETSLQIWFGIVGSDFCVCVFFFLVFFFFKQKTAYEISACLVGSKDHARMTVRRAFEEFGVVSFREYISRGRQGLNSLRQSASPIPAPLKRDG